MDEGRRIAVSPSHSVVLREDYAAMVDRAPRSDFVVRTLMRREVGSTTLTVVDLVIAGESTRAEFPLAATYPLHVRKVFHPAQFHGDPAVEFERQKRASELAEVAPPIGCSPRTFRSCLVPGIPFAKLSPFGAEPEIQNLAIAAKLDPARAIGLYRVLEDALSVLTRLHEGGLAHGDAELHNFIVSLSPIGVVPIDFESAVLAGEVDGEAFRARCESDRIPMLRESLLLECALGPQRGRLASLAREQAEKLFEKPAVFLGEIERQSA